MSDDPPGARADPKGLAVPSGRLSRFGHFGRLAGGVAGGMLVEGARRLAEGERPRLRDMLLTPGNVGRLADRLSHLRGAAMKLGQMISMDAGDMLPPELTEIMARLRQNAHRMPPQQLQQVLAAQWGKEWRTRFAHFDATPIAAASIGQVHRARTRDGRDLAIKVQYPGVRDSIDSDVDNVATLLRVSGLLPRELDIAPLLAAAKEQLREETDYLREGEQMALFGSLLANAPDYVVPICDQEFTTGQVLAMSFVEGRPIESLIDAPQETRDAAMRSLIALVLRELFEFGMMQTDPNFANYRYQPETGRLVLLDFGASRPVAASTSQGYRELLSATIAGDRDNARAAALAAGFVGAGAIAHHRPRIDRMIDVVIGEMNKPGPFDFGDRGFVEVLRDQGTNIATDQAAWHIPPADLLFVQRKISGTALLAARLRARIDVRSMVEPYLPADQTGSDGDLGR
ncbi:putative unusual protein kinase regulating ubiquinone biosynthesis (AarF/ABC1/UbiB family) [Sphingomonas vulcanisoli]|uniref:Unusual protein kinase regulating ubiquinone biosynthesis (AarF/ABC1/UbiB family) n=1 Tax=Sphingomonas vulcanisoli TaxID=1658060 RepID=A0ABX0TSS8_9SPHN|nr:putative unusual protein kinase regulating ubiquinone biosynthesis (AarF/ABC1/UbiB family) [Sphingomonas vulcanisoli]